MASSISLFDPKAYHIIAYGTYLGTTFFQSFVAGPVAYRALPRPMFARLQEKLTPVLFTVQSLASALVILTFPGERTAIGTTRGPRMNAGISGLFDSTNFGSVTMPLLIVLGTSIANLAVVGPMTTKIMKQRHHQETRDGKKSYDAGPHSAEMRALNKRFAISHSIGAAATLAGLLASLYYGLVLGAEI